MTPDPYDRYAEARDLGLSIDTAGQHADGAPMPPDADEDERKQFRRECRRSWRRCGEVE